MSMFTSHPTYDVVYTEIPQSLPIISVLMYTVFYEILPQSKDTYSVIIPVVICAYYQPLLYEGSL